MAHEQQPLPEDDPNADSEQRINALATRLATLAANFDKVATRLDTLEKAVNGMKGKVG